MKSSIPVDNLREMSVRTDHKVGLAVLVDDFGRCLQPNPAEILGIETVRDQTGASCLDYWKYNT